MEYPLTDQYYSPTLSDDGRISKSFNLDAKQTFSRIASVDNQTFKRCLWVPDLIYPHVLDSIKLYDDLKDLHSRNQDKPWKDVLSNYLDENHKTLYKCIINEANITKKSIMETLKDPLKDNIKEMEISEEDEDFYEEENFIDDAEINDELEEEMEDDGDDDYSDQIKEKNLEFLKSKLKNKRLEFEDLFDLLFRNKWFKSSDDKKNRKKCFIFNKKENLDEINCKRASIIQALTEFKELQHPINGQMFFSYSDD